MRIGFLDSGIGGITVLHQALKYLPNDDYIFYADTSHVPYGEKPKKVVKEYIFGAADFLAHQNVKALVIACNTATSIAIDDLRNMYDFPILGIEPAVKPAVQNRVRSQNKVLVLATNLTLREEKFHNLVKKIDHHDIVEFLALPGLVELAEKFEFRKEKVIPYLKEALSAFDINRYGTIVLGCTHFSYFADSLQELFPKEIDIISGNMGTAKNLKRILTATNRINEGSGDIHFLKSGQKIEDETTLHQYKDLLLMLDHMI